MRIFLSSRISPTNKAGQRQSRKRLETRHAGETATNSKGKTVSSGYTKDKRRREGLCTECGGPRSGDLKRRATGALKTMCRECLKANADKQERYRIAAFAKGLCTRCKNKAYRPGKKICQDCADYATAKGKIRREKTFFERRSLNTEGMRNVGSAKMLWSIWKEQRGRCALTGVRLTRHNCEIDHIVPRSKGGSNDRSNIRWLLYDVNQAKRNLMDEEFLNLCRSVIDFEDKRGLNVI
jgi:5-methylcytosine-specific restriction endonuclease McrA